MIAYNSNLVSIIYINEIINFDINIHYVHILSGKGIFIFIRVRLQLQMI